MFSTETNYDFKNYKVGNLCLPSSIDEAVKTIEKSDVVQALQNLQIIGSINGVSWTAK